MTSTDAPPGGPVKLPRCPACDARLLPNPDGAGLWCQFCGVVRDDGKAQALSEQASASGLSDASITTRGAIRFMSTELRAALGDQAWTASRRAIGSRRQSVCRGAQRIFSESADICICCM